MNALIDVLIDISIDLKTRKVFYELMQLKRDNISHSILRYLAEASEPLETKEIEQLLPKETRTKILYRLNVLRGDGLIKGKAVGSGKGCWIWWKTQQIMKSEKEKQ